MRILFRKISDTHHALEITREDGRCERVECETRSYLLHDLVHYAVEREAAVVDGFWGSLAQGKTLAQMNDRSTDPMAAQPELAGIERVVGALQGAKGKPPASVVAGIREFSAALGATSPGWLTEPFVVAVEERLRRLLGHWRATPHGGAMELDWTD
jgi:hypothetical protein